LIAERLQEKVWIIYHCKEEMMVAEYRHTQYGILMGVVFLVTGALIVYFALEIIAESRWESAVIMICLYVLGVASFHSFTIEVSEEKLKFRFGIGIIQKSYFIAEIKSVKEVINPWYYFWGVKSIPGGWFYAIAPGEAIEIILKNGKVVQLGTNQSKMLKEAIDAAIQLIGEKWN
jgi:hypothetical protein